MILEGFLVVDRFAVVQPQCSFYSWVVSVPKVILCVSSGGARRVPLTPMTWKARRLGKDACCAPEKSRSEVGLTKPRGSSFVGATPNHSRSLGSQSDRESLRPMLVRQRMEGLSQVTLQP